VTSAVHIPQQAGIWEFQHRLLLEFPDSSRSENCIAAQLLGPSAATMGMPVALTWQLLRVRTPLSSGAIPEGVAAEDEVVFFEVRTCCGYLG
jgi:hypothetical protein